MRQDELTILAPRICQLARQAGDAIMRIYAAQGEDVRLTNKSDDSPLTQADLASHHCICDGLHRLTPDLPVVSEEDADSLQHRLPQGCFWLIDPLDGTKEFLARNGEFTVNIALVVDGEPVWGVVYAPVLDQMYWGGRDFGAFRQQQGQVGRALSRGCQQEPPERRNLGFHRGAWRRGSGSGRQFLEVLPGRGRPG